MGGYRMSMTKSLSRKLYELLKSEFPNSSQNLANFARGKTILKSHYRVYKDSNDDLYLGFIDDTNCFCGAKLLRIACGNKQTFAFGLSSPVDVTEWFLKEYSEKGMCAYTDMRHTWNQDDHEDKLDDGSIRTCQHCGKVETLHSKMVRKTWWQ